MQGRTQTNAAIGSPQGGVPQPDTVPPRGCYAPPRFGGPLSAPRACPRGHLFFGLPSTPALCESQSMAHLADRVISVLVADDDEEQRILIEGILGETGWARHAVTTAVDGRDALRALREGVFDVALLDLSMPGLDGLEVFEAIGEDPHRPQVVFVTGHGTVKAATRAMKLGAYDFVEKPVDPDRLAAIVWKAAEAQAVISRSERFKEVATREASVGPIVTRDRGMQEVLDLVARVGLSCPAASACAGTEDPGTEAGEARGKPRAGTRFSSF